MSRLIMSSDPQAAQGAGRLPRKGFRPDNTAQCQCKTKHTNTSEHMQHLDHHQPVFQWPPKGLKLSRQKFALDFGQFSL